MSCYLTRFGCSAMIFVIAVLANMHVVVAEEPSGGSHTYEEINKVRPLTLDNRIDARIQLMSLAAFEAGLDEESAAKTQRVFYQALGSSQSFAGSADEVDKVAMRAGITIGALPFLRMNEPETYEAWVAGLEDNREFIDDLDEEAAEALRQFLVTAKDDSLGGRVNLGKKWTALFNVALRAMGDDNPRRHGYLAGGMWASNTIAMMLHTGVPAGTADLGNTLVKAFEEDARAEGADRRLAEQMKLILAEIEKEEADAEALVMALEQMLAIAGSE